MLTLYYNPLSPNARRVWLTLLEKQIPFEPVLMKLDGDQSKAEFLKLNPFHHIPVLVDGELRLIESLAIMDYLELRYPTPSLLPNDPSGLATVRMVQMVIANELFPQLVSLIYEVAGSPQAQQAQVKVNTVLAFLEQQLGDRPYFGSHQLTLADIVAGTTVPLLPRLGLSLAAYSRLDAWCQRLLAREIWQHTQLSQEDFESFKRRVRVLVKLRRRELSRHQPTALKTMAG